MEVYKKPRKSIVEVVDDAGKSVLRYRGHDRKLRYVASSDSPEGGGGGAEAPLVEATHAELKAMRDGGKLTAGALYRITDYNCTTTQENTRSAGHQFDIVLLALSENKLAEEGWAMEHPTDIYDVTFADGVTKKCYIFYKRYAEGVSMCNLVDAITLNGLVDVDLELLLINEANKTATSDDIDSTAINDLDGQAIKNCPYNYFQNSNLSAWKVWYCLDNDKSRFAWADEENGKGVIYRLIDEFNNDIKYDFKNIQFKRKITNGQYDATNGTETWCYTLNIWYNNMCQDASIIGNTLLNDEDYVNGVYDNKFGYATAYNVYIEGVNTFAFALGNNVVLSTPEGDYYGIYSNTIGNSFTNNTIGSSFTNNVIGSNFNSNTIGNSFGGNTIGNYFSNNTIGNSFYSNTIGNGFGNNTIGNDFYDNTIGNDFIFNTIGNSFGYNTIGNSFQHKNISTQLTYANYGNNGVELATKS